MVDVLVEVCVMVGVLFEVICVLVFDVICLLVVDVFGFVFDVIVWYDYCVVVEVVVLFVILY